MLPRLPGLLLLLVLGIAASSVGQTADWTAHTSMREVQAMIASDGGLWVGTTGGLFRYAPDASDPIQQYTTVDGLHGVDIQALTINPSTGYLWIGYADGTLNRFDSATGRIETFYAVARASRYPDRTINRLKVEGGRLWILTAFGVVIYDLDALEVEESYLSFGSISAPSVHDLELGHLPSGEPGIWVATSQGVVRALRDHPNLRDPSAWTVETVQQGEDNLHLAELDDQLYVGTDAGLYRRRDSSDYTSVWNTDPGVRTLQIHNGQLVALSAYNGRIITPAGTQRTFGIAESSAAQRVPYSFVDVQMLARGPEGRYWLGDGAAGLGAVAEFPPGGGTIRVDQQLFPNGPLHGFFNEVVVDTNGSVWASSDVGPGTGFYHYHRDGEWTSYTANTRGKMRDRAGFVRLHAQAPGFIYAGSRGDALIQRTPNDSLRVFDESNSTLTAWAGAEGFIDIGGITSDAGGRLWVTNRFANPSLNIRLPDGSWKGISSYRRGGLTGRERYAALSTDRQGTHWIMLRTEDDADEGAGLLALDSQGTPADPEDDRLRLFEEGSFNQGLPDNTVTDLEQDIDGEIWIGTRRGVAVIRAPELIFSPSSQVRPEWLVQDGNLFLNDLVINDLAVDPANQKWLATPQGAWLLDGEGTEVVQRFTADNSPIPTDQVHAVTVDQSTGEVYFATEGGLMVWQGVAVAPPEEPARLKVYPNPARIGNGTSSTTIYIEGTMDRARVRILSPSGRLVEEIQGRGGRLTWDGTDRQGALVPSGVYVIVALGPEGDEVASGKVAVVN